MSSESVTHSFCIESLRYAYQILGYDNIVKELEFIHHLNSIHKSNLKSEQTSDLINLPTLQNVVQNISESNPILGEDFKSDSQNIQELPKNKDDGKQVVLKAKRGRKPLSAKKVENTDTPDIKQVNIQNTSCTFQLSNQSICSIKRYTSEDPNSIYCYNHYKLQK